MSNHLPGPNHSPAVHRQVLHHGVKFNYERLSLTGQGGGTITREVVRHPGAVVILPVLDTPTGPQVVLIRNWRVSIERWLLELPAGTLEKNEAPELCAARELEEETGYAAATIVPLGRFYTSPGLSDELMWAFVARGLRGVGQRLEVDEQVTVHPTPLAEALAMITSGELADGKSIAALLMAKERGLLG